MSDHDSGSQGHIRRLAPWTSRIALFAAGTILALIAAKFIAQPDAAGAASGIALTTPLAHTNMRASFGAFPLGCAIIAFASLLSERSHRAGLAFVAIIFGTALAVRLFGSIADGTFAQSRTVLGAETIVLILCLAALLNQRRGGRKQAHAGN